MPTESIVVGADRDGQTERVTVEADRTEWDRDGTLRLFDDGTQVGEFPTAEYAVREKNLEG